MPDPYAVLGVARDASADDVRKAYRKLAKQHHPDLNPGNAAAEERFKTVAAANALLSDPEQRGQFDRGEIDGDGTPMPPKQTYRQYAEGAEGDRYRRSGPSADMPGGDFADLFESMFGRAGARTESTPAPGRDEHYTLVANFLEAINGATRRLTLPDGRTLDVKIPPGTATGQTLRLRGQGGRSWNGGPGGDALIEIHVAPHPYFERNGNDIKLVLPVTLSEAVIGGMVRVPTPAGAIMMRVPPHSDSGTELRLRGKGVPKHAGRSAGDLHAILRVVVGAPDAALDDFLQQWKPETAKSPRTSMGEA